MAGEVKRPYSSPRREQQARQTRRAVTSAAERLFVAGGYGATTLQQIADEADVAVQTIYAVFGNKQTLLEAVLDVAIAGDDEPVAVNDRNWMTTVFQGPTADARLVAYASAVSAIHDRAGDMFSVLQAAADIDPEIAVLAQVAESRRRAGATSVVAAIDELSALRADLDSTRAVDVLWTLNSPELYRLLVRRCGWDPAEYERWLGETMISSLLTPT